jgi:hypothetical protein
LKHEERNAETQQYISDAEMSGEKPIQLFKEEIHVFEIGDNTEIDSYAKKQEGEGAVYPSRNLAKACGHTEEGS